jgi:hypothetical protein
VMWLSLGLMSNVTQIYDHPVIRIQYEEVK